MAAGKGLVVRGATGRKYWWRKCYNVQTATWRAIVSHAIADHITYVTSNMTKTILSNFSLALASSLNNSADAFPVDFDRAWQWLGFSRKDNAKSSLMDCDFTEGIDFLIKQELETPTVTGWVNPKPLERIQLTVDCFKTWGMMVGTEQGKQVRKYFLECERVAKSVTPKTYIETLEAWVASEKLRLTAEARLQLTEPIYKVVETRPNLHIGLSTAKPELLKILGSKSEELYTAKELKDMFNMQSSVQAIAKHLAAVWRSQYSVNVPRKTAKNSGGEWKDTIYHKPFAYPLEWAKEQLRLVF
jgi:phage anti-repressor protein